MKKLIALLSVGAILLTALSIFTSTIFASGNSDSREKYVYNSDIEHYADVTYSNENHTYILTYDDGAAEVTDWKITGINGKSDYSYKNTEKNSVAVEDLCLQTEIPEIIVSVSPYSSTEIFIKKATAFYANGIINEDIAQEYDSSSDSFTFSYNGGGTVTGWELPNLKEGVNYEVIDNSNTSFTVKLINGQIRIPYVNVLVDFSSWPVKTEVHDLTVYVDGSRSKSFYGEFHRDYDDKTNCHTFTYEGDYNGIAWEFPNLTEGVNYEVVESNSFESITIRLINGQKEIPYVNIWINSYPDGYHELVPVTLEVSEN